MYRCALTGEIHVGTCTVLLSTLLLYTVTICPEWLYILINVPTIMYLLLHVYTCTVLLKIKVK